MPFLNKYVLDQVFYALESFPLSIQYLKYLALSQCTFIWGPFFHACASRTVYFC